MSYTVFDDDIAVHLCDRKAMILKKLEYWEDYHKSQESTYRESHFHNGRWWTYYSHPDWAKLMPYLASSTIRKHLADLVAGGWILKGDFSKNRMRRVKYYSVNRDKIFEIINPKKPTTPLKPDENALCRKPAAIHAENRQQFMPKTGSSPTSNSYRDSYRDSTTGNKAGCPDKHIESTESGPESSSGKSGPKFSETDRPQKCLDHENRGREILAKLKNLRPGILGSEEKFIDFWNQNPQPLKLTSDRLKWISSSPSIKMNLHRLDGYFTLISADSFMRVESYKHREQIRDDYRSSINVDERQSVIRLSADDLGCTETEIIEWANLNNNDPYFKARRLDNDNIILANLNF